MLVRKQDLVISEISKCLRNILLPSFIYPSAGTIQVGLFYPSVFANMVREATCSVGETKALEWSQNAPHSPEPWTRHTALGVSAFLCKRKRITPTSAWLRGPATEPSPMHVSCLCRAGHRKGALQTSAHFSFLS